MKSLARTTPLLLMFMLVALVPRPALSEYDFTSKTYVKFYNDARNENYAPLYEYLEMESKGPKGQYDFYVSGWWGHDFSTLQENESSRDELTNAYLKLSPFTDNRLLLSAGRHPVVEGIVAQQIDGISARWEPAPYYGCALFGGSPVETVFDARRNASVYGGRVYQRIARKAEFGLSFLSENNSTSRFREETGFDVWLRPAAKMEVKGHSLYNNITEGWGEHAYTVRFFPVKKAVLSGAISRTSYEDTFSAGTLTVFSPDFLGKDERLFKKSGLLEYRFGDSVTGVFDYGAYSYQLMGDAAYYGAKVQSTAFGVSAGASLHRMEGAVEKLRYRESRVFAAKDVQNWRFSVDAINLHYDLPFNGLSNAYSVNSAVRWSITDSLTSTCSVDYGKTPDMAYNTTALLSLTYNFNKGK